MEGLSRPARSLKIPLTVTIPGYLRDHRYEGRTVLPAAEALQILARSIPPVHPPVDPCRQEEGAFAHLLLLDAEAASFDAFHEIDWLSDGRLRSRLTTLRAGRRMQWTRRIEHASVAFLPAGGMEEGRQKGSATRFGPKVASGQPGKGDGKDDGPGPQVMRAFTETTTDRDPSPRRTGFDPDLPPYTLSFRRLYEDLIPFGPAYQNVAGEVCLTPAGASAIVHGGHIPDAVGPLGSPFALDAALHVACAWGQRYRNLVAFPVGFDRREIIRPTRHGEAYVCHVFPLPEEKAVLRFDIRLYDESRRPVEMIGGVRMRDISGGRLNPPAWVRKGV